MELLVGLALELVVSIFLCFFLAKFVSSSTTDRDHHCWTKKRTTHHCKLNPETVTKKGFASETLKVDQFCGLETCGRELSKVESSFVAPNLVETFYSRKEVKESNVNDENKQSEIEVASEEAEVVKFENDDDDDWEGIERSELERVFGAAVVYVGNIDKISRLANDLKLQFYGLYKVAIEGPCLVPQPMPLKISARAKWNAWQQLGNMSPEVAMENYIDLLSRSIPNWMDDCGENCRNLSLDSKLLA